MPRNALHSKNTPKWGTPADIIARARRVMGRIDLDPCSSDEFQKTVQAKRYYSLDDRGENGLELPWYGRVLCNPPGGLVKQFWRKAFQDNIEKMVWIGFSLEQLATLANESPHPLDYVTCIPRKRIHFTRHDGYQGSPTHSNYITGVNIPDEDFFQIFSDLGKIVRPH